MNKQTLVAVPFLMLLILSGCTQQAPAPSNGNAVENGDILLGAILPLTGDAAEIGQSNRQAIELAVEQINAAGGINGRNLKVLFEDGRCSAEPSANAANKLVNVDKVTAIVGGVCSSETLAIAPIAEAAGVPEISQTSSNPAITNAGDYIFRVYPSDSFQGKVAAEYAFNKLGARKIAFLNIQNDWAVGLTGVFERRFTELGGQIVAKEQMLPDAKDVKAQLTKVRDSAPDLIYMPAMTNTTVVALQQASELGIQTQKLGGDGQDDPAIVSQLGATGNGFKYTVVKSNDAQSFVDGMNAKGNSLAIGASQAYDAVFLLANAMKTAGTDGAKIKDELYKVKAYPGASGTIGFDEHGDLLTAAYSVKEYNEGELSLVEDI